MKKLALLKRSTIAVAIIVVILFIVFAVSTVYFVEDTSNLLNSQAQDNLQEITSQATQLINSRIDKNCSLIRVLSNDIMQYAGMSDYEKMRILKYESMKCGFVRMALIDAAGKGITTDDNQIDVSDMQYFKDALNGKSSLSGLLVSKISNQEPIVVYSVPIYKGGKVSQVLVAAENASNAAKLTSISIFNSTCYSYIVNHTGDILFHPYESNGDNYTENILSLTKQHNSDETFKQIKKSFSDRGASVNLVNLKNQAVYLSFAPVNAGDWMFVSILPQHIVFDKSMQIIWRNIVASGLVLFFAILIIVHVVFIRRKNRREINKIAYIDRVTGIWNYNKFMLECEKLLQNKSGRKYAIIYFDIENFKVINDVFGYDAGDQILIKIANELSELLTENQIFARLSNDYFAILTVYQQNPKELVNLVKSIKEKINHITVNDNTAVILSLPMGIYLIREDETNCNKIVNKANLARDAAKSQHNTERYAFFDEDMRKHRSDERAICSDIQNALETKQFEVYYQAKFELKNCSIVGYEALIRWNHPEKGLIRPDEFIPIAEKRGYIADIDRYVFECVCSDIHNWMERGIHVVPVSFNLSRIELYKSDLLKFMTQIMQQYQVPAEYIEAEITETATVGMTDYVQNVIGEIRKLGIKVSMDDFGTGASSLSCLKIMPIDIVKLDKSFLSDIEHDTGSRDFAKSVITLAKSLDLSIIAEGVETLMQAKILADAGCDMVQGYYFAKPLKKEEAEQFMLKPMQNLHLCDCEV